MVDEVSGQTLGIFKVVLVGLFDCVGRREGEAGR